MTRQYLDATIEELEKLVREHQHSRQVLGEVRDELTFRRSKRAKQLLREVEALLRGEVGMPPRPPPPDSPENQLDILDNEGSDD